MKPGALEERPDEDRRIDWSGILPSYEVPTVLKNELLRPYFEKAVLEDSILDAGCGQGYFSRLLVARGYRVLGLDSNGRLESDDRFRFQQVDFILFKTDQKFGTVLLINVLTTVSPDDRLTMLKKIKEIKTDEGIAYVVITNAELFGSEISSEILSIRKIEKSKVRLKVKLINGEYIEFDDYVITQDEMERMCREAGLQILKIENLESEAHDKPIYQVYLLK